MNLFRKTGLMLGLAIAVIPVTSPAYAESGSRADLRIGAGANYWWSIRDTKLDDIDEYGIAWLASAQIRPQSLLFIQMDLEYFQDGFLGIDGTAFAPQAFLLLGSTLYGGAGIGIFYEDGTFDADPFYLLRAGLDLKLLPRVHLDFHASYRFTKWSNNSFKEISTDTATLGLAARIAL